MRYKFGPRLDATLARPAAPGEPADVPVDVTIGHVEAADPGLIHVHLAVAVPAYTVPESAPLLAVHAVAFAKADAIPTDPRECLAAPNPQGSLDCTGQAGGISADLVVHSVPEGAVSILTVLVFDDGPPTTPPADPTPADPTDPTDPTAPADPAGPAGPTDPAPVAAPADPTDPTAPADPTDPTAPSVVAPVPVAVPATSGRTAVAPAAPAASRPAS